MEVQILISKENKWKRIIVKTIDDKGKEDIKSDFSITEDTQITIIQ